MRKRLTICVIVMLLAACNASPADESQRSAPLPGNESETATLTEVPSEVPTSTPTSTATSTPIPPTETSMSTPLPLESLKAKVVVEQFLSCRYGPGAEYLFLYALRNTANIELIGRADASNWVLVNGKNLCWVNAKYLEIAGDPMTLKVMYPDGYRIPRSPYYSSPAVLSATRDPNDASKVTVTWTDIALRAGDEEDENMFIYIIEVWRCEGGQILFDPLASNYPEITFVDEAGCSSPSHGRVYFQEKHGFAGPADISWPAH